MEWRLSQFDYKGGWQSDDNWWLFDRLQNNVDELDEIMLSVDSENTGDAVTALLDIANYCMMMADNMMNERGM